MNLLTHINIDYEFPISNIGKHYFSDLTMYIFKIKQNLIVFEITF